MNLLDFEIVFSKQADLSKPETIPATMVGVHTVIDCATGRPEEPIKTVGRYLFNFLFFSWAALGSKKIG